MISKLGFLLVLVALLALVDAQKVVQVINSNNFCTMMPPPNSKDRSISGTEGYAQAFCLGNTPSAKGANKMPSGFIKSAHFASGSSYVQVTGTINPAAGRLNSHDEGGQYDIKAPTGSSCAGYKYYVNLIEPSDKIFCIRCCNDQKYCNRGISEKGCRVIIPGDYSSSGFTRRDPEISNVTTTPQATPSHDEVHPGAGVLNHPGWTLTGFVLALGATLAAL